MKALTGPRVAVLSVDGLDTHEGQIMVLDSKLKELDNALESFRTELGAQAWAQNGGRLRHRVRPHAARSTPEAPTTAPARWPCSPAAT